MKENQELSRQKFLSWGIGIASLLTIPAFLRSPKKKKEGICGKKEVKMLTQDGRLVTIDVTKIPETSTRIEAKDIHTWISKKKSSL
jgi:hypothetical protein